MNQSARRLLTRSAVLAAVLFLVWPHSASAQQSQILVTRVEGPITPVVAAHVADAVDAAVAGGYHALLIEMDTPGGLDTSMRGIVQDLLTAKVPTIVYVSPAGARAASAGAIIAFASHVAAMAPATNIGAATPISLEGGEVIDKVINDAVAYVTAIAEERDRDVDFAVDTVREGRSAAASEAVEIGAVDLVAESRAELLAEIDGRTVVLDPGGDRVRLATEAAALVDYEMSWTRRLLQSLANPELAFLFISVGSLALLYELSSPGGVIGGVIGTIMIVLAFFSLSVLPVNIVGVLLLFLAIALFVAELFVPGIGVFAGGGVLSLVAAGLFLFDRPTGIGLDLSFLVPVGAVAGLGALAIARVAWVSRRAPAYSGTGGAMTGAVGTVRSGRGEPLRVFVDGALWKARAASRAPAPGDRVRVVDMDGIELVVEGVDESADA
ncbi:MAG: nodulation protein NfeD [Nitriliruptorales bacterium]|nr:nodulation protein NfeD [Nitriliruptorales bacterium]